jgi:hypothetical protein
VGPSPRVLLPQVRVVGSQPGRVLGLAPTRHAGSGPPHRGLRRVAWRPLSPGDRPPSSGRQGVWCQFRLWDVPRYSRRANLACVVAQVAGANLVDPDLRGRLAKKFHWRSVRSVRGQKSPERHAGCTVAPEPPMFAISLRPLHLDEETVGPRSGFDPSACASIMFTTGIRSTLLRDVCVTFLLTFRALRCPLVAISQHAVHTVKMGL